MSCMSEAKVHILSRYEAAWLCPRRRLLALEILLYLIQ